MRSLALLLCTAGVVLAGSLPFRQSGFNAGPSGAPEGWTAWSPRAEIAPRTFVDTVHNRGQQGSLAISGNSNPAVFGGWQYTASGVQPGKWYRLVAHYRTEGQIYQPLHLWARLDWTVADGRRVGQPEYGYATAPVEGWSRITTQAPAPEKATAVKVQLFLLNSPQATVWWDDISLEEVPAPPPRNVTVASINFRPSGSKSAAENVRRFVEVVDKTVPAKVDVILLPEGITIVGTGKTYVDVAEPVPGPTTDRLGEAARRHNAYVAAGIYEREGSAVYNTAVLIDRTGKVVGRYRKVYIPREELEGGITPGLDYPVFETDFGRVGMMICWDLQFADPSRALALRGAELLLLPIWGGDETLGKGRAIENRVFIASSGYDYPTYVMDPAGERLSVASQNGAAAVATIDLNRRYVEKWLGDMRGRFMNELRLDLTVERNQVYVTPSVN
jgi:predicted amidohydrolase